MNKHAKILTYYFKDIDNRLLIILDLYYNFKEAINKLKLIYNNDFYEFKISDYKLIDSSFVSEKLSLNDDLLTIKLDGLRVQIKALSQDVLLFLNRNFHGKNASFFSNSFSTEALINDEKKVMKGVYSWEYINSFQDYYYKLYTLDFKNFIGASFFLADNEKASSIAFFYKGEQLKERKYISFKYKNKLQNKICFSLKSIKRYKFLFSPSKVFLESRGIFPFKIKFGKIELNVKALFKNLIKTASDDAVLIYYNFRDKN